ncbi:sensor domain-containing phosphodiesterase [Thiohalophilus thiocyanatoxydans]|uniref:cyclic-guanylate-specific phosphodiesterase n=1 Tax=Thiohalophilus thiocyanatoxydans TaxID=381308 RepID=A0A4R8IH35_9GAMM|nr:EAL domain-containing protein [Thiohalophilus thiocyanatoxydans]TDX99383.1 PAS domain S-box-containing protein/diguanylate cyclase (GGDEF)-like protein [Thiohalophilus thiocyanatoxydans]
MNNKTRINLPGTRASAARIAAYYGLFSIAWILLSDRFVSLVAVDAEALSMLQSAKGLIFVGLSTLLVFLLCVRENYRTHHAARALSEERQRLAGILEGTRAGTWEWDVPSGRTVFNARWAEMIGYTLDELAPLSIDTWSKLTHPDDLRKASALLQRHFDGELDYYECECRMRHKQGHWVWILDRGRLLSRTSEGKPLLMLGTHTDITRRKQFEAEIQRMSRLYATLSETNQAIVRVTEQGVLFQKICDIAVEHGGFSLAWVGLPNEQKQRIEVCASSGQTGYLDGLHIAIDAGQPEGRGPTAQAYLTGERRIINDFAQSEITFPWHEQAEQFNIHASAAFPLRHNGAVFGVLSIYASEPGFFQRKEIELLEEMAEDIGFGLENYHRVLDLAASEARFHAIADGISDAIVMADPQRNIQWINSGFVEMFGYNLDEIQGKQSKVLYENAEESARQGLLRYHQNAHAYGERYEVGYRRKTGEVFIGETLGTALRSEDGELLGYVALIRDVTEQRVTEEQLRIAAAAFEVENGIMITDHQQKIERVNHAFTRITGYEADEVIGRVPTFLKSGQHSQAFYQKMWQEINEHGYWEGEIWNRRKNGDIYPEWLTISVVKNEQDDVTHYIGSFSDITERKAAEQHIHQLAFYDPLTQLANRRLFVERIEHSRLTGERSNQQCAILMLDLDNFKVLNDTRGHHAGDQLLVEVGRRLKEQVRAADTVARFGGDEFVVLLEALSYDRDTAINMASDIAEKIQFELSIPYDLDEVKGYRITSSIGVVLFLGRDTSVEELLKQTDVALYEAKSAGRNTVRFFNPEMQHKVEQRAKLETALSKALEQKEFLLYYQPQVNHHGELLGAEALLRWVPSDTGLMVSPAEFIPLAEDTGLIVPIGYWVIETACRQLHDWQQQSPDRLFNLAVNISARQFHQHDFVQRLQEIVHSTGVNPSSLKLELTETVVLDDIGYVIDRLHELRTIGIGTSMDDFGTGYSSLSYLKRLPMEQIKIDNSFVRDIAHSAHDSAIVRAIIAMGHSLGLQVVAEGVETEEQRAYLEKYQCDVYQGYLFDKPMPVKEFEKWLN